MNNTKLRPWQEQAIKKSWKWMINDKKDHRFLINAAPGSGKTLCATMIAKKLIDNNKIDRVIVIAPLVEVVSQWADEFEKKTGRHMSKITGFDKEDPDVDICSTWASVKNSLDLFQTICNNSKTLIICDEHHHAAFSAAWGIAAESSFKNASYVLVLTGTPMRSDSDCLTWFAYTDKGRIDYPDEGTYTLTYGEAVKLGYCRPITFHRHFGKYSVNLGEGNFINVLSGEDKINFPSTMNDIKDIPALQKTLEFYKLACRWKYKPGTKIFDTQDTNTYQASLLEKGIVLLDQVQNDMPQAAGLVITHRTEMANYMAGLLETLTGEKPVIVHNKEHSPHEKIKRFRKSKKNWIVSVGMVSEGIDIKRLRVLVYLPRGKTELFFRQAMGRIVRNYDEIDDFSFPQVVMPNDNAFDTYAKRIESEMPPNIINELKAKKTTKICPTCNSENSIETSICKFCGDKFPEKEIRYKTCEKCEHKNPVNLENCQNCGNSFENKFEISLEDAFPDGGFIGGEEYSEDEMIYDEDQYNELKNKLLDFRRGRTLLSKVTPQELELLNSINKT